MIIFLDFDGVLHPIHGMGMEKPLFCRTELLWQILRACPDADVVFSTSWREMHAIQDLIDFVTQGGGEDLAQRFIGATPCVAGSETGLYYRRETECLAWLDDNEQRDRPWLALDDFDSFFSPGCPALYLVDHATGLTEADATAIIERLS